MIDCPVILQPQSQAVFTRQSLTEHFAIVLFNGRQLPIMGGCKSLARIIETISDTTSEITDTPYKWVTDNASEITTKTSKESVITPLMEGCTVLTPHKISHQSNLKRITDTNSNESLTLPQRNHRYHLRNLDSQALLSDAKSQALPAIEWKGMKWLPLYTLPGINC